MFSTGDKVRLLKGKEEGVVLRVLPGRMAEVQLEEGFVLPLPFADLVKIHADEDLITGKANTSSTQTAHIITTDTSTSGKKNHLEGICFFFRVSTGSVMEFGLYNGLQDSVLFACHEQKDHKTKGIAADKIEKGQTVVLGFLDKMAFEQWPVWLFQLIRFRKGTDPPQSIITTSVKVTAKSFNNHLTHDTALGKDVHVYRLDLEKGTAQINPTEIKKGMTEKRPMKTVFMPEMPPEVVDLHAEKLTDNHKSMEPSEILGIQLGTFENLLDAAMCHHMAEITFIHGVGAGVLRNEIHLRLSRKVKQGEIKYFEDANKNQFGYGATKVKIG